jgi:SAM-dependent methyltransferase
MRWLASRGLRVTGVDRSPEALEAAAPFGETIQADLENGVWPLVGRHFDVVLVTHYLWRALLPTLIRSLAEGGTLIYETFAAGNETVGRPSRPDFLLNHGELLATCGGLRIVAYEDGFLDAPARFVQRIVAVRAPADALLRSALVAPQSPRRTE